MRKGESKVEGRGSSAGWRRPDWSFNNLNHVAGVVLFLLIAVLRLQAAGPEAAAEAEAASEG